MHENIKHPYTTFYVHTNILTNIYAADTFYKNNKSIKNKIQYKNYPISNRQINLLIVNYNSYGNTQINEDTCPKPDQIYYFIPGECVETPSPLPCSSEADLLLPVNVIPHQASIWKLRAYDS